MTPPAKSGSGGGRKLTAFWQAWGRKRGESASTTTWVLAITSNVPHLIAYNIVKTATALERVTDTRGDQVLGRVASADFTRIAASDR